MKCDRCRLESDVEQAFSTQKRFLRKPRHFCPDCTVKREAWSFFSSLALLIISGLLIFALRPSSWIARLALETTLIILSMIPLIVIHEIAHAVVAQFTDLPVFGIVIGIGKPIWSGKLLGIDWTINALPTAGVTAIGPRPVPYIRLKLFLTYLAGPASHVVMAFAFFLLGFLFSPAGLVAQIFRSLAVANILLAVLNLFPQKVPSLLGMQGTDGWHLLHIPFWKKSEFEKRYVGYYAGEALQAYLAHDFDAARKWLEEALALDGSSGSIRNILGMIQMAQQKYQESRATFTQLLETQDGKEPALHYILLNNIAYLDALLQDTSLLPEADQYSAEAFKHLPWVPAVIGTRGTVLLELGQCEEGIALLKKSMALADKHGKALDACHIAMGEMRRGNPDEAHKYLASAKVLDPDCILIPNVEAQLARFDARVPAPAMQAETI